MCTQFVCGHAIAQAGTIRLDVEKAAKCQAQLATVEVPNAARDGERLATLAVTKKASWDSSLKNH